MTREDYLQYYIQGSNHYLIPKDIFDELFTETKNWKKEAHQYKEVINKIKDKLFNANSYRNYDDDEDDTKYTDLDIDELLDILKEVEHE